MTKTLNRVAAGIAALAAAVIGNASVASAQTAPPAGTGGHVVGDTISFDEALSSGLITSDYVKLAKRVCPTYAMIPSNISQSTDAESALPVLGPNPYASAASRVDHLVEDAPGRSWAACTPVTGWEFQIGTGRTTVGGVSRVANPEPLVWLDNADGTVTLSNRIVTRAGLYDILGVAVIRLTPAQRALAEAGSLNASEVNRSDPGFGTLRCGGDRTGGDNLKQVRSAGDGKVYCYAYNSTQKPAKLTVKLVKTPESVCNATPTDNTFPYTGSGNLVNGGSASWNMVPAACGSDASSTQVFPQLPPGNYDVAPRVPLPGNWTLVSVNCVDDGTTTKHGDIVGTPAVNADVDLVAGDAVTCTYVVTNAPISTTTLTAPSTSGGATTTGITSSSVAGTSVVPTTNTVLGTTVSPNTLPRTGGGESNRPLATAGAVMALLGAGLLLTTRRFARR
jgi:LPXTG-motif cell wall-anchored protein